ALARLRALEPPPWAGRDAAGTPRAASGGAGRQDASLPCGRDGARRGRGRAAAAHTMATARPIHRRRPPRGRREAGWVGNGTTGRGRGAAARTMATARGPRAAAY